MLFSLNAEEFSESRNLKRPLKFSPVVNEISNVFSSSRKWAQTQEKSLSLFLNESEIT